MSFIHQDTPIIHHFQVCFVITLVNNDGRSWMLIHGRYNNPTDMHRNLVCFSSIVWKPRVRVENNDDLPLCDMKYLCIKTECFFNG